MNEEPKKIVKFAAINPTVQRNIIAPTETRAGRDTYINWGDKNAYPDYLLGLYRGCSTLKTAVDGFADYIAGNDVTIASEHFAAAVNRKGQTPRSFVRSLAFNYALYGGFAVEVLRSKDGRVAELYATQMRFLRTDAEREEFHYNEHWVGSSRDRKNTLVIPKFLPDAPAIDRSILYVTPTDWQVYPVPVYAAAARACEVEKNIDDFHLNALDNGFLGGVMFNFRNGIPEDEVADEVERDINEKFGGTANAARILVAWSPDNDHGLEVKTIDVADYGEKYKSLASHCRQQIFTAFRANPNIFGIPTENLGFNNEEYEAAFRLFNRTMVQPVQSMICDAINHIIGGGDMVTIEPFTLEPTAERSVK